MGTVGDSMRQLTPKIGPAGSQNATKPFAHKSNVFETIHWTERGRPQEVASMGTGSGGASLAPVAPFCAEAAGAVAPVASVFAPVCAAG